MKYAKASLLMATAKRPLRSTLLLLAIALAAGCAITRGSHVAVGTPRAALSPEQVKLYLQAPRRYVHVGLVSATAESFLANDQKLADSTVSQLKLQAAAMGANGVLIGDVRNVQTGSTGTAAAYSSKRLPVVYGTSRATMGKEGDGIAIFVLEE